MLYVLSVLSLFVLGGLGYDENYEDSDVYKYSEDNSNMDYLDNIDSSDDDLATMSANMEEYFNSMTDDEQTEWYNDIMDDLMGDELMSDDEDSDDDDYDNYVEEYNYEMDDDEWRRRRRRRPGRGGRRGRRRRPIRRRRRRRRRRTGGRRRRGWFRNAIKKVGSFLKAPACNACKSLVTKGKAILYDKTDNACDKLFDLPAVKRLISRIPKFVRGLVERKGKELCQKLHGHIKGKFDALKLCAIVRLCPRQ